MKNTAPPLPEIGFVRLPTVLRVYPISRSSWWAGVKAGKYPPGHKLSERVTAWRVEDIRALLQDTHKATSVAPSRDQAQPNLAAMGQTPTAANS